MTLWHRSRLPLAVAAAALVLPAAAAASAQPLAPAANAVVTSHPTFTWANPAGETTGAIDIASAPTTTDEGGFVDEAFVDVELFSENEQTWTAPRALFAGSYWWMIETWVNDEFDLRFMPPAPFTVAAAGSIGAVKLRPNARLHRLGVTVEWAANTPAPVVVEKVRRAGTVIWTHTGAEKVLSAEKASETRVTWRRPGRVAQGTRLVLSVTLKAGSFARTVSRPFRAP